MRKGKGFCFIETDFGIAEILSPNIGFFNGIRVDKDNLGLLAIFGENPCQSANCRRQPTAIAPATDENETNFSVTGQDEGFGIEKIVSEVFHGCLLIV